MDEPIAVVGVAGSWPSAPTADAFRDLCVSGVPQVRPFPARRDRMMTRLMGERERALRPGAYFSDIDVFDAKRFGVSDRDAQLLDPVHRRFLGVAVSAFVDAGLEAEALDGSNTGVFVGYCPGSDDLRYWEMIRQCRPELESMAVVGNLPPLIPGRISYLFNLSGPSLVVDTACSSSLVAIHQASRALQLGDCDTALVGGVKLILWPEIDSNEIGIESVDGVTRPFGGSVLSVGDAPEGGTGIGEGAAAVVLKRLSDARRDGDRVHVVIAGSACNHDGQTVGLTVPSVDRQLDLILAAWADAGIDGTDIGYVEGHGTGTRLGDPIEFTALSRAFRSDQRAGRQRCAIGSAKSVLGHLDAAAGITGLLRAAFMVRDGVLYPSKHFAAPNAQISYVDSALYVNDRLRRWPDCATSATGVRHAGVSAFSMNGTNAHVVLRQHTEGPPPASTRTGSAAAAETARYWLTPSESSGADTPDADESDGDIATVVDRIWLDLLGDNTPPEADFFAAGGDSLKAAIMVSRLASTLDVDVHPTQVWETPVRSELVRAVATASAGGQVQVTRAGPRRAFPLLPSQRPVFVHSVMNRDVLYNVPFAMRLDGPVDSARLRAITLDVCAVDPVLNVVFAHRGNQILQKPRSEAPGVDFTILTMDPGTTVEQLGRQFVRPFDVQQGPLVRFVLAQVDNDSHVLFMDFHHLVLDGVSVALLWQRLVTALAKRRVEAPQLSMLDYAAWWNKEHDKGAFEAQRTFWEDFVEASDDAIVRSISSSTSSSGKRYTTTLPPEPAEAATSLVASTGVSLFATLITAYAVAIRRVCGQSTFNIGTPLSGRTAPGTQDMLGMFVNLYPVPFDLDGEQIPKTIERVHGDLVKMLANQAFPLAATGLRDTPTFNVAFALQNMDLAETQMTTQLSARPVPFYDLGWDVAKFDLSLFAMTIDDQLVLSFEYRDGALPEETVTDLCREMSDVLSDLRAN